MGAPGCDDAPLVDIVNTSKARDFTPIVPYYENPLFFTDQIKNWSSYPVELSKHLRVIVVDDGSQRTPALQVLSRNMFAASTFDLRLFRIAKDVRWNWLAARNIGAHHAETEWIMMTDMDHVLEARVLETLVHGDFDEKKIYRFSRREHHGAKVHPHPNSWFMTKDMFWKVGGYDEALSGYYGTDGEYRRRCAATAQVRIMTDELVRHEYVKDSSTTLYKRKQLEDAEVKRRVRARGPGWKPKTLSFQYNEVNL